MLIFSNRTGTVKQTKLDEAICIDFDHLLNTEKKRRDFFLPLGQNSEVLLAAISPRGYFELLRECPLSETKHIPQNTNDIYIYFSTICCNHDLLLVRTNTAHLF